MPYPSYSSRPPSGTPPTHSTAATTRSNSTPPNAATRSRTGFPTVYDIAGPLIQSARLDKNPPTIVQPTQDAISWLSRAIAELDESSEHAPTSLAETLARLLAVWTFTDAALGHGIRLAAVN